MKNEEIKDNPDYEALYKDLYKKYRIMKPSWIILFIVTVFHLIVMLYNMFAP